MPPRLRNSHVFINCPFDDEYRGIFRAIVFASYDCGFVPRCALERSDGSETRIEKIFRIIGECRLGIHDISRTQLDKRNKLPRFNMPLELGVFLGAKRFGRSHDRRKQCLILDKTRYRFQKFCSDIAGQDVDEHRNSPRQAVQVIRDWFAPLSDAVIPSGPLIYRRFQLFERSLPLYCDSLGLDPDTLIFNDYATFIEEWLREEANE